MKHQSRKGPQSSQARFTARDSGPSESGYKQLLQQCKARGTGPEGQMTDEGGQYFLETPYRSAQNAHNGRK